MKLGAVVLGERYRDKLHGIEGIAGCRSEHLTGCDQVRLDFVKDGELVYHWVDITQLEGVEVPPAQRKPGGVGPSAPPARRG